jgi:hypothetical protein
VVWQVSPDTIRSGATTAVFALTAWVEKSITALIRFRRGHESLRHRYTERCLTRFRAMQETQPNNPLHGVTLEQLLNELVSFYGWDALGRKIEIRCFTHDPSITSSLKFLRRTPWARERVEALYIEMIQGN